MKKKIELLELFKERYVKTEAFKTLRTNLLFSGKDVKVITVTSCTANEGKSSLCIELSKNMAQVEKKVLLIDADLRKSVMVSKNTDATGVSGLSEYLSGQKTLEDVLYETQYGGFDIIFAGQYPPNPVDLLSSEAFKELMQYGREHYDYVLIDTAPLGLVIDAAVTSSLSDGALLVIGENRISYRFAQAVKEQIEKSGCRVLGVVLNLIGTGKSSYYYHYYDRLYYGKYGRYYSRRNKNSGYGSYGHYGYGGYGYGYGYGYGNAPAEEEESAGSGDGTRKNPGSKTTGGKA